MEPLKKGDLVMLIASEFPQDIGICGTVIDPHTKELVTNDVRQGRKIWPSGRVLWGEDSKDYVWLSCRDQLLKITPPPTMTETEQEITA